LWAYKNLIKCPECGEEFWGDVDQYEEYPWPIYFGVCPKCHYIVTESEWDEVHKEVEDDE
jgi:uncharacterized protein with PIN domain